MESYKRLSKKEIVGEHEGFCCVYVLCIGKESYIGATTNLGTRKYHHIQLLHKNMHKNLNVQTAYNNSKSKKVEFFVLESTDEVNLSERELYFIKKLNPTLNVIRYHKKNNTTPDANLKIQKYRTISGRKLVFSDEPKKEDFVLVSDYKHCFKNNKLSIKFNKKKCR